MPAAATVIALHPAVLARYEEQLNQLQAGLAKGLVAGDSESAEAMRDLIETVTVFRDPSRLGGVEVEIAGRLTALLGEKAFPNDVSASGGMVVAGERYRLPPLIGLSLPASFLRLAKRDCPAYEVWEKLVSKCALPVHDENGRARLQGFPDDWVFCCTQHPQKRQIGNALPPVMALAVGLAIYSALTGLDFDYAQALQPPLPAQ